MEENKISFKHKLYNRVVDTIVENTSSFALITKKLVERTDCFPLMYVGINNSNKVNLKTAVGSDVTNFDIIIMTNNPPENYEKSGNEILLELAFEVEYALAKPMNWNTNHLNFPGIVKDCYFTGIEFYDDESSGDGNISCVLLFSVEHVGEALLRPMQSQKSI